MQNNKIIVILGQTSTGKSDFAVEIALRLRSGRAKIESEIISADSRQVYKGMNLGTGKITKKEMHGIPHHILNVVSPTKTFSVSDFQKLANKKIEEIIKKGKIPILCGGTGFYIDAIINGTTFPEVPPNKTLRKQLYPKSAIALFGYLEKLDPKRAKTIDKNNKVRLIRAIEIAKALGKIPPIHIIHRSDLCYDIGLTYGPYRVLKIGLTLPPEILKEKIRARLLERIKKGMIKEVENLHKNGVSWKRMNELGLEYRYVSQYLQNIKTVPSLNLRQVKEKMIEELNTAIWHYAKRQKTWFKRDPNIIWIDPRKKSSELKVLKEIKKFLK